MLSESAKTLLTGLPRCGKTTAVMKIIANLNCEKIAGFYTQEIRVGGVRKGFSWRRLDGVTGTLAHVDIKGSFKVGKYGVDVAFFEKAVVPILDIEKTDAQLFIIDEIGKMECFSKMFVSAIRRLFKSDKSVLATVALKGSGLISEVKDYPDTRLFNLTHQYSEKTIEEILQSLRFFKKIVS
ncbi:MAG: nucleoside-triphosphatase [Planctomycetota bacterium]|jgi:nucleoside-triphosphatase